jgi:hypothetical protein
VEDGAGDHQKGEDDPVVGRDSSEGEFQRLAAREWDGKADWPAREPGPGIGRDSQHLREGQRRQREIVAFEADGRKREQRRRDRCQDRSGHQSDPGRHAQLQVQQRRGIRADSEEACVAERNPVGEATYNIPGLRGGGE